MSLYCSHQTEFLEISVFNLYKGFLLDLKLDASFFVTFVALLWQHIGCLEGFLLISAEIIEGRG